MKVLAILLALGAVGRAAEFFVSPSGHDGNPGSRDAPFATISRAQLAVRSNLPTATAPMNVWIDKGVYELKEALNFTSDDSSQYGVTYAALPPATSSNVIISGGSVLHTDFTLLDAKKNLWRAILPNDTVYFRQLWANGERRGCARTPLSVYPWATSTVIGYSPGQVPTSDPHNIFDMEVVLYESWTASIHQVQSMNSTSITLRTPYNTQWAGGASGKRFYVQNIIEALDTPGEFYYDRVTHELRYMALPGEHPPTMVFTVPRLVELVHAEGTPTAKIHNTLFENVTFAYSLVDVRDCFSGGCDGQSASFLTSATVHVRHAVHFALHSVRVAHTGGYAVWFDIGCSLCALTRSHTFDSGAGAVRVGPTASGVQPSVALRVLNCSVSDNLLEDGGYYYQEGCGVLAQQVAYASILHNEIRYFKYTAVSVGWTWGYAETSVHDNLVLYNHFHHIGNNSLSDMGCVYTLGRQPGTVIGNNICHDVQSYNYGGWAYYTDEGSSNMTYINNIAYNIKCAGHHQHYGTNNELTNNIYAYVNSGECDCGIRSSQHAGTCDPMHNTGTCSSFSFHHNIVLVSSGDVLCATTDHAMNNMTLNENVYFATDHKQMQFPNKLSWSQWQEKHDSQSLISDPLFVDGPNHNFTLLPNSPALKLGFKQIDVSTVGPRFPLPE